MIAVYKEPLGQRYANTVDADSPQGAEIVAQEECRLETGSDERQPLWVAGVVAGSPELLDVYTDGFHDVPGEVEGAYEDRDE